MKYPKRRYILSLVFLICALFFAAPSASAATTEEMQQML